MLLYNELVNEPTLSQSTNRVSTDWLYMLIVSENGQLVDRSPYPEFFIDAQLMKFFKNIRMKFLIKIAKFSKAFYGLGVSELLFDSLWLVAIALVTSPIDDLRNTLSAHIFTDQSDDDHLHLLSIENENVMFTITDTSEHGLCELKNMTEKRNMVEYFYVAEIMNMVSTRAKFYLWTNLPVSLRTTFYLINAYGGYKQRNLGLKPLEAKVKVLDAEHTHVMPDLVGAKLYRGILDIYVFIKSFFTHLVEKRMLNEQRIFVVYYRKLMDNVEY